MRVRPNEGEMSVMFKLDELIAAKDNFKNCIDLMKPRFKVRCNI